MSLRSDSGQQGWMYMSVSHPNVTAEPREIGCAGASRVTFSFQTASELSQKPADIVLILDVSGSLLFEIDEASNAAAPAAAAKKLRDDGVEIYCTGLLADTQRSANGPAS